MTIMVLYRRTRYFEAFSLESVSGRDRRGGEIGSYSKYKITIKFHEIPEGYWLGTDNDPGLVPTFGRLATAFRPIKIIEHL